MFIVADEHVSDSSKVQVIIFLQLKVTFHKDDEAQVLGEALALG